MHHRILALFLGIAAVLGSVLFFVTRSTRFTLSSLTNQENLTKIPETQPTPTETEQSEHITPHKNFHIPDKKICFTTQPYELSDISLSIEGTIPSWLSGTFYYNGPAQFELGSQPFKHTFDGFAMVHRFTIDHGQILYANKYVESTFKKEAHEKGKLPIGFVENEKPSWFNKVSALLAKPKKYDNTNTHLWMMNDTFLALTETPDHIQLDPKTLITKRPFSFPCSQKSHTCTIHPLYDIESGQWYNLHTTFGHTSQYQICTINPTTYDCSVIANISVDYPSYIHSFSLTTDYIVVVESPFVVNPYDLLGSSKRFVDHFVWKPERKNRLFILDKKTGKEIQRITFTHQPFFFFHMINAFQQQGTIHCDIITYPDVGIVRSSSLLVDLIDGKHKDIGHLERFSINLKTACIERKLLCNEHIEFPAINQAYRQHKYTYIYGTEYTDQSLKKIDIDTGTITTWHDTGFIVTEPQFISRPGSHKEDDGVLLAITTDTKLKRSGLLILDAQTLKPHAYAWLNQHIPLGYHGLFVQKSS